VSCEKGILPEHRRVLPKLLAEYSFLFIHGKSLETQVLLRTEIIMMKGFLNKVRKAPLLSWEYQRQL